MRLIIAGSRTFNNYDIVSSEVLDFINKYKDPHEELIVFSGGARGVDKLGERFAKDNNYVVKIFKADWTTFGRAAGPIRNQEMAREATHCIVFWNGESKGSKSMIQYAKQHNLITKVVLI